MDPTRAELTDPKIAGPTHSHADAPMRLSRAASRAAAVYASAIRMISPCAAGFLGAIRRIGARHEEREDSGRRLLDAREELLTDFLDLTARASDSEPSPEPSSY